MTGNDDWIYIKTGDKLIFYIRTSSIDFVEERGANRIEIHMRNGESRSVEISLEEFRNLILGAS